jgi:hypothetical protein
MRPGNRIAWLNDVLLGCPAGMSSGFDEQDAAIKVNWMISTAITAAHQIQRQGGIVRAGAQAIVRNLPSPGPAAVSTRCR